MAEFIQNLYLKFCQEIKDTSQILLEVGTDYLVNVYTTVGHHYPRLNEMGRLGYRMSDLFLLMISIRLLSIIFSRIALNTFLVFVLQTKKWHWNNVAFKILLGVKSMKVCFHAFNQKCVIYWIYAPTCGKMKPPFSCTDVLKKYMLRSVLWVESPDYKSFQKYIFKATSHQV